MVYPITFRTLEPAAQPKPPLAGIEKLAIVKRLRDVIEGEYSYRDLRLRDWDAEFAKQALALEKANNALRLATALAKALEPRATST